jgi:hypothetical protein
MLRVYCRRCRSHQGFEPKPVTVQDALAVVMRYGRYRNQTIAEISASHDGRAYLEFVARNDVGLPAKAAAVVLDAEEGRQS